MCKKKKKVTTLQGQLCFCFCFCLPLLLNSKVAPILSPRASSVGVGALMHSDVEI